MINQKIENLLNLSIDTPEVQRMKSLNLNVGFQQETRTWELIVKYNGSLNKLKETGILVEELIGGYAILTVPEDMVEGLATLQEIEYIEKPKRLFFSVAENKEKSCISPVTERNPFLSGEGTIVAIIDSGIDYTNPGFCKEDGSSRIIALWDQSILPDEEKGLVPPEGFYMGAEFRKEQIDKALKEKDPIKRYQLVPSVDVSGHGTAVAGIAAGNGQNSGGYYAGVAPKSNLLIVKLGILGDSFPRTTELMRALTYVVREAQKQNMPIAINLSFGNTYGAHDGTSLLECFLDKISEMGRTVICVGNGNEGNSNGHVQGRLEGKSGILTNQFSYENQGGNRVFVELAVSSFEPTLNVQLWKNYVDIYRVFLQAPGGEQIEIPIRRLGKVTYRMEQTDVLVYVGEPTPYSIGQEIYFDFLPVNQYIDSGIWTFILEAVEIVTGQYFFYLPSQNARNIGTEFYKPSPEMTMTIPATARRAISVGAYDSNYDSYADFSGRGYVSISKSTIGYAEGSVKPDLVAPGVDIMAPDLLGGFRPVTGTSFAAPFVTGAAALLMEWGIVKKNDLFLYGEKVKAYLQKGARPIRGENIYPNEKVGYGALCVENSLPE